MNKTCKKCEMEKPLSHFSPKKDAYKKVFSDRTMNVCKKCRFGIDYKHATKKERIAWIKKLYEKNVIKNGEYCWRWKGNIAKNGYATMCFEGKKGSAHRFSWIIHYGDIPKGYSVLHKCDCRHCTNPEHLKLGTHQDNMDDMNSKGYKKVLRGEECPWTNLTNKKVAKIKKDLARGIPNYIVAQIHKVTKGVIDGIKSGKKWKHVKI